MNHDLLRILEEKIEAKTSGIFHLGRGPEGRKILFDGESFLFSPDQYPLHFPEIGCWQDHIDAADLNSLLSRWYSEHEKFEALLDEIPDLETSSLDQLTPQLTTGVLVDSFICCGDAFLFEQGSDQNLPNNSGTSSCQLLEAIEKQTAALEDALKVLPSGDELLILSPSGVQCRDEQTGWAFSRIGMLIDGFRSVRELMEDSPFSPCQTLCHLARAASDGLAYKKKFPELARVRMTDLDGDTRVELLEKLEQATTMAAEPIRILEKMRQLHQISGEEDLQRDAALRIADAHRSARNPDSAIAVLEEILEEVPDHESARASHIEILVERAEQLLT